MSQIFKKILLGVVACHLVGLLILAFWTFFTPARPPLQKITVRTISFDQTVAMNDQPSPQLYSPLENPPQAPQLPPKQTPGPEEKKTAAPPPPTPTPPPTVKEEIKTPPKIKQAPKDIAKKKKETPPKKEVKKTVDKPAEKQKKKKEVPPPPEKTAPPAPSLSTPKVDVSTNNKKMEEKRSLLAEAKKKLSRTTADVPTKHRASLSLPDEIEPLSVETLVKGPSGKDAGYVGILVSHLKQQMILPERGDVELLLTLNRSGKIVKATVTRSPSVSNKSYVQKRLSELSYPPFDSYFDKMETFEFEITLRGT